MRLTRVAALVALLAATAALAGIDVGPAVGSQAPVLAPTVTDAAERPATLRAIAGREETVLLFFRSRKWCPYCQHQMT